MDIEKIVAETIAKTLPVALSQVMSAGGGAEHASTPSMGPDLMGAKETSTESLSDDLLNFTQQAFSKSLTRDTWKTLVDNYPEIEDPDALLGAPNMETGMKEDIRKKQQNQVYLCIRRGLG